MIVALNGLGPFTHHALVRRLQRSAAYWRGLVIMAETERDRLVRVPSGAYVGRPPLAKR